MTDVTALLEEQISGHHAHWHLGTFGVVAEFMRDADEPAEFPAGRGLAAYTDRGAIRIEPHADLVPFAYELAMTRSKSWSQQVALCLPKAAASMNRRPVVTALGTDADAVRPQDRDMRLFDLGLARLQMDALVRTRDAALIDFLAAAEGRSLFDPSTGVMPAIFRAQPHRVFVTRFGRAEVFQPIPSDGASSPPGPHTHVLPKLMKTGRTHAANAPIPKSLVPCGGFSPAHPLRDAMGVARPFEQARHLRFQAMLERFGDPRLAAVKRAAAELDQNPSFAPVTRHERVAARVGELQREAEAALRSN